MSNWTIGKRMIVGFAAVLTVAICLGGFAYSRLMSIDTHAQKITGDSLPGLILLSDIRADIKDERGLVLDHILAETPQEQASVEGQMKTLHDQVEDYSKQYVATITSPEGRELFAAVASAREAFASVRDNTVLPLSRTHKTDQATQAFKHDLTPAYTKVSDAMEKVVAHKKADAKQSGQDIADSVSSAKFGIVLGLILALLVSAGIAFVIVRSTNGVLQTAVQELSEGSEQVVAASSQVSSSAQSLSQGATEQAASLEETSASMEEMASMTRKNAENTQEAASLMGQVDSRVSESNQALGAMVRSMEAIKESSGKVSKIIKTIDEIAFQTNILALNAAVEAARAGEAGMGFAVVADEVRNLAQRSAQAAKDTASLIEEAIANSQEGSVKVEQVASAIGGITESVTRVKGLMDEVSVASSQQTQGIDQVSQAVAQMEKVTQTTAATAEESAAASEELNAQAEASRSVVGRLQLLIGGAGAAPKVARARKKTVHELAQQHEAHGHPQAGTPARKVMAFTHGTAQPKVRPSAEEQIPLGNTGTYGDF
ncbi:MAG: MCP four helix bundle domain-containing protein [Acidobacteriota bacterium]|nr:MCP four helix bundle domain-containing protein [Acidobacteriota bacterium]